MSQQQPDWGRLMSQGRAKAVGVMFTDKEEEDIRNGKVDYRKLQAEYQGEEYTPIDEVAEVPQAEIPAEIESDGIEEVETAEVERGEDEVSEYTEVEDIKELRRLYKEKYGKGIAPKYINDAEYIKSQL